MLAGQARVVPVASVPPRPVGMYVAGGSQGRGRCVRSLVGRVSLRCLVLTRSTGGGDGDGC